jgi:uncharacterized OB-fold protein
MSDMTTVPRVVPIPDERSAPFWRSAADGVLAIQRCDHCGEYAHPPTVVCSACLSTQPSFHFEPVSGNGVVRTWIVVRTPFLPAYSADVPYVVVDVELAEQPNLRLLGRLVDGVDAELRVGADVETVFAPVGVDVAVPQFRLTRPPS